MVSLFSDEVLPLSYICGIKFLIWLRYCFFSGIATKAAVVFSIYTFANCYGCGFMLIFS